MTSRLRHVMQKLRNVERATLYTSSNSQSFSRTCCTSFVSPCFIDRCTDDDDGEIGEERREEADEDQGDVGRMPRPGPYQHEPEPQQPAAAGQQGEAGAEFGDGVGFRGNRDVSRLDPRNTDDW